MTAKDVLLLPRHRYLSSAARSKFKFQTSFEAYLGTEFFFGYSNYEFIDDNSFNVF